MQSFQDIKDIVAASIFVHNNGCFISDENAGHSAGLWFSIEDDEDTFDSGIELLMFFIACLVFNARANTSIEEILLDKIKSHLEENNLREMLERLPPKGFANTQFKRLLFRTVENQRFNLMSTQPEWNEIVGDFDLAPLNLRDKFRS